MSTRSKIVLIVVIIAVVTIFLILKDFGLSGSSINSVQVSDPDQNTSINNISSSINTSRDVMLAESITLPLQGSAPTMDVKHSIPIEEVRRGCFRQDCIPSVDDPVFVSVDEIGDILAEDSVGIGLIYNDKKRFYPFDMLVTREIVNDTIGGDPVLVTYCPLCGTGIVFERSVNGKEYKFGVSGMLWQSNLLMYNRAEDLIDRNLWSQVLGEAVIGNSTGIKLKIIPSNIVKYSDWNNKHPDTLVLNTGRIGDPYNGNYYDVAQNFGPNFNEADSPLDPSTYVHGVEIGGVFKAYPDSELTEEGVIDEIGDTTVTIVRTNIGEVNITDEAGNDIPIVTGFWFSWIAAHPDTKLWQND